MKLKFEPIILRNPMADFAKPRLRAGGCTTGWTAGWTAVRTVGCTAGWFVGLCTVTAMFFACSSSPTVTSGKTDTTEMRPCPRLDNTMPASLQTPCREIDGKYYVAE